MKSSKFFKFFLFLLQDVIFLIYSFSFNIIKFKQIYKKNVVLATAASKDYFKYLLTLLENVEKSNLFLKIIVYDLGLETYQVSKLKFSNKIEIKKFNFNNYPGFYSEVSLLNENKIGSYAWKSVIINETLNQYKTQVFWFDSANQITGKCFIFARMALTTLGVFSVYSTGSIKKWTYPSVLKKLKIKTKIQKKTNLNGAIIGFDYNNKKSMELMSKWLDYCSNKELIAPKGSSRKNHRHDQSLLSILYYQNNFFYIPKLKFVYGVKIHQWQDRTVFIAPTNKQNEMELRDLWYQKFAFISTNTFKIAKTIVFLDTKSFKSFSKFRLLNKSVYILKPKEKELELSLSLPLKKFIKLKIIETDENKSEIDLISDKIYNFLELEKK